MKVIERTPTTRAGDILGLRELNTRRLQDGIGKFHELSLIKARIMDDELVGFLVDEKSTDSHRSLQLKCLHVRGIERKGDGIILDTGLSLSPERCTFRNHIHEFTGHGDLTLGLLTQGYAHGVADPLRQQGTDTHSRLDTPVLTLTGFSNAEVQRIVHTLLVHRLNEQSHGGHHHNGVRGLDGDHHIVELFTSADTQKLHTTLHDTRRRVAIARHDTVGQRTVVHTDTHSGMMLLADIQEGYQLMLDLLQLGSIFLIGIFQMLEGTTGIDVVTRIDTHLLTVHGRYVGGMGREVHIGHQGGLIAVSLQLC